MEPALLVIDVGLSNCKCVLFSRVGAILARAAIPYPTMHPQPGWAEQDPEDWWAAAAQGTRRFTSEAPEAMARVSAIGVTGHMHALVSLGPEGTALGRALVLGDQRSAAEAAAISTEFGQERIYRLIGARMDPAMPLAKLAWLRAHAPAMHRDARAFLSCKDWLRHRLTGDVATDPVDACGTALYDIMQRMWSPELAHLAGIRETQLPPVLDPCAVSGRLIQGAARALGLTPGIPVIVGAGDDVEVVGNGLFTTGQALEHLGTTGSILTCADVPLYDPHMALELYPHVVPGLWVLGGSVTAAGAALEWAQAVLRPGDSLAPASPAARPVFVPHLSGARCPNWEPRARGGWISLSAGHTAEDLRQAVLDGVAFSLRRVLDGVEALAGPQREIRVSGHDPAHPNGREWLTLRAGIYRRPVALLDTPEPTALGAMLVAAVGADMFCNLREAAAQTVRVAEIIEPDPGLIEQMTQRYAEYIRAEEMLRAYSLSG
jgi:xylulokinase